MPPPPPHIFLLRRFFVLSFALSLLCGETAFGDPYTVTTPEDLIRFSGNMDEDAQRATVYLAADLDFTSFSDQFTSIGTNGFPFKGTLDGQGHVISNLNLTSSSYYLGLSGYSIGAAIRNVTMDGSCSVTSSYTNIESDFYVGSIVGFCYACTIENVVNMASVTFTGSVKEFGIGGISGRISSSSTIRNCVNYGSVTFSGFTDGFITIGGISGYCKGETSSISKIQNCANYGTLTNSGKSNSFYRGGIVGYVHYEANSVIENCLSAGKYIDTTQGGTFVNYIGRVVGCISSSTTSTATPTTNITHCLWTSDVGYSYAYGYKGSSATVTVTNSTLASLNATAMNELNEYAEEKSWDKWFMLHLNGGTINNLTQDTLIVTQKHFPDPAKEGYTFWDWYLDEEYDEPYNPNTTDITTITELYAGYTPNNYIVTFYFGNGTTKTRNVTYSMKYGTIPDAGERTGWTFVGWFTSDDGSGDEITSESTVNIADNHDLYACWFMPQYTLRFILNNGESDVVKTLNYGEGINYPKNLTKEGYSFSGWSLNITTMPAHNLNITAQWTKVTEYVEVVFARKDLSEDDVKTIIRKYTGGDDNFVIAQFIPGEEIKVIIKFNNEEKAQNFVEIISTSSDAKSDYITRVDFTSETISSFSSLYYPNYLFSVAF